MRTPARRVLRTDHVSARLTACAAVAALIGCSRTGLLVGGAGGADNQTPPIFPACVADSARLDVPRLAVYILFDTSKSMSWSGQWEGATSALSTFFGDPKNGGLDVALRLFPATGCDAQSCDAIGCAVPTVDAAPLMEAGAPEDLHEAALNAAVAKAEPAGNTPMYPAMEGAFLWADGYRRATDGNRAAVVLVTDGEPSGCNNHVKDLVKLVSRGLEGGTRTFVVGLAGTNQTVDDRIAEAGGTGSARMVGLEDTATELAATLDAIRDAALVCTFAIPASLSTIDPATTNVSSVGPHGDVTTLHRVAGASSCATGAGWYFEDASFQTVTLCPASCDDAARGVTDRLYVTQGCASL
ncbi:MAG: vWA domain-containing protein [Polyangiaceae bacterium]